MKPSLAKISLIIVIIGVLTSCNTIKRVGENEHLLTDTSVYVNDKKDLTETVNNLLYQKPNSKLALGIPLRLHIYNLAKENPDSTYINWLNKRPKRKQRLKSIYSNKQVDKLGNSYVGLNNWIKKTGEAPVIVDTSLTRKSQNRLEDYFWQNGWFDVESSTLFKPKENKRAGVDFFITTGKPYLLDSLSSRIDSPIIDSLYQKIKKKSLLQPIDQYRSSNFEKERSRITTELRNSGVYHFSQDYVTFDIDSIKADKKVNVELKIPNRIIKSEDSTYQIPFKLYRIKDVNILTDYSYENRNAPLTDSITYNNFNIYSAFGLKYKPKALTDAIFITPGEVYKDIDRTRTYRYISELKTFKYPNIEFKENVEDTTLTANIFLTPRKKYSLGASFDVTQSNIQTVGFSFSGNILTRNIFKGAEILELSAIGSIGASKDPSDSKDQFFDINELGANLRLTIPRLFSPFNTDKIVPKYMSPSTRITLGATSQRNIGLDKQTLSGIFNYRWYPSAAITNRMDLFNVQFVKNLNTDNYFEVYQNSFSTLNAIAQDIGYIGATENLTIPAGADNFLVDVLDGTPPNNISDDQVQTVNNISERKQRLTENNLIFATNFGFTKDKRENLFDNDFSIFRAKLELAGNALTALTRLAGQKENQNGKYEVFGVAYSQYVKTELDYVKHWSLGSKNVLAMRSFFGFAIPYGNSTSIPFSRSFFAGGTNDNRAWTAYNLGPGTTSSTNEFNEANLKLAFNIEHRYNLFGNFNGAFFIDAGNIWNALDDVEDEDAVFKDFSSLGDIAIGAGFGLRYDFSFFVLRFDIGFKAHDPSYKDQNRWFNDFNFKNAVYNIGINYPF
ncbi:MAG: outer membrane protein assembly factor [Flavobacteriaceae bacterium]|nr:BamA/TamA family outer membrane protein [Bacteroidia bacterium]NNL61702.1 BamA/TamA family outer membrane protein [Flavobacteriaceae bacterium]RZV70970.1 MAG: outer membrane protein assembly factor [Flavobacteriaceae bacterium]